MAENFSPVSVLNLSDTSLNTAINNNFLSLASILTDVLSRSGTTPNQMSAALDMNSNRIINLGAPVNSNDAARLADIGSAPIYAAQAAASATVASTEAAIAVAAVNTNRTGANEAWNGEYFFFKTLTDIAGPGVGAVSTVSRKSLNVFEISAIQAVLPAGSDRPRYAKNITWSVAPTGGETRTGYPQYYAMEEMGLTLNQGQSGRTITVSAVIWSNVGTTTLAYLYADQGLGATGASGKVGNTISGTGAGIDYTNNGPEILYRSSAFTITSTPTLFHFTTTLDDLSHATIDPQSGLIIGLGTDYSAIGVSQQINFTCLKFDYATTPLPWYRPADSVTAAAAFGDCVLRGDIPPNNSILYMSGDKIVNGIQPLAASLMSSTVTGVPANNYSATILGIADQAAPTTGLLTFWASSTSGRLRDRSPSGAIGTTVVADAGASNNFLTGITTNGVVTKACPSAANLSDGITGTGTVMLNIAPDMFGIADPALPAAGYTRVYGSSVSGRIRDISSTGIGTTVVSDAGATNNFLTGVTANGVITKARPSAANLSNGVTGTGAVVLTAASAPTPTKQVFIANGTYTAPTGCTGVKVTAIGGGGGGGGSATTPHGGGGGSGAEAFKYLTAAAVTGQTVTVGTGGTNVALNTAGAGGNGTASSVGSLIVANGGTGGTQGAFGGAGGAGGTVGTSDWGRPGAPGGPGADASGTVGFNAAGGGQGGGVASTAGTANSGGGGGSGSVGGASGAGGTGIVIVEEFYI